MIMWMRMQVLLWLKRRQQQRLSVVDMPSLSRYVSGRQMKLKLFVYVCIMLPKSIVLSGLVSSLKAEAAEWAHMLSPK